jgi:serine/threonine-protein kinase
MGEVYKAEDLKLDQTVALKFLPDALSLDAGTLARFHTEVRLARQVSHPNVCRVYDVGEVEGLAFLTMEFIDGEDLTSLLRRIGRLPGDKAIEVARQLCAGLAAAHDAGVIHRDLKPSNVMIDGRGRARVADFGVAAIAREVKGEIALAGTPAYMSPEQLRGAEASIRSDIYALGLVLYELFTGKRVSQAATLAEAVLHHSTQPTVTAPSSWVSDLDPAVERVILRCLDSNPLNRPASAMQVAAALPGGDPLQAALAAGETPSPELVAASGSRQSMKLFIGAVLTVAAAAGMVFSVVVGARRSLLGPMVRELSADVLAHEARRILTAVGYSDPLVYSADGFNLNTAYLGYAADTAPEARSRRVDAVRSLMVRFWYRESPTPLTVIWHAGLPLWSVVPDVTPANPPRDVWGMRHLRLDSRGRLLEVEVVPYPSDDARPLIPSMEWEAVFKCTGLPRDRFQAVAPRWTPPQPFDERTAWTGAHPDDPALPITVEAAAFRGQLVAMRTFFPWDFRAIQPTRPMLGRIVLVLWWLVIGVAGSVMAWRNWRARRGDLRGAVKLGVAVFVLSMAQFVFGATHVPSIEEVLLLRLAVSQALLHALTTFVIYLAAEPYIRRRWPGVLIGWSRAMHGEWRDPLVAREVLIVFAIGGVYFSLSVIIEILLSRPSALPPAAVNDVLTIGGAAAAFASRIVSAISMALILSFLVLAVSLLFRSTVVAAIVGAAVLGATALTPGAPWQLLVWPTSAGLIGVVVLTRYGFLSLVAGILLFSSIALYRAAFTLGGGTAAVGLGAVLLLVSLAGYFAVGGRTAPRSGPSVA